MAREPTRLRAEAPARWVAVVPGVQMRPMVEGNGAAIVLYRIRPGTQFEPHAHAFSELGVVLAGEGRMVIEEEERRVREGDSFFIPPRVSHGFEVAERDPAVVLLNVTVATPPDASAASSTAILRLAESVVRRVGPHGEKPPVA